MSISDDRDQRVDEAIAEYLAACEADAPPDRDAFLAEHPDLADSLRAFLADHDRIRQAAPPPRAAGETATLPPGETRRPTVPPLDTIKYFGDYELLEEIARGGMGVVYRARQVSLNREVAVKLILAGEYAGGRDIRRFKAEAEAAANLDHPNILPIFEVGEHQGQQYFSMKLVAGGSLSDRLGHKPDAAVRPLVALLSKVCHAVHFAHQRRILHRDLKPSNILLDADGTPYVTDFGLAKKVDAPSELTQSGALVGTPSYMPPEQARGEKRVTTAGDVYSLGAILYEMLTGRPPFRAETVLDTVLQVLEKDPDHPRTVNPSADRDLSVIALKCLDKDPARRYPSAAALADDLERWAQGEPILARPVPAWEKGWKWAKRHPAAAALLAMCVVALAAGVAGLAVSNRMIAQKQRETDAALRDRTAALADSAASLAGEQQARQATADALEQVKQEQAHTKAALAAERRAAYLSDIALAANEWAGNRAIRAGQLLDGCAADLRGWEWHYLQRVAHAAEREFDDLPGLTMLCGFTPDGKHLLTSDFSGVRLRDFATGKVVREFTGHQHIVSAAALSPDGKRAASAAGFAFLDRNPCEVILWDTATGQPIRTFATDHKGVSSLAFSADGKWLATVGGDRTVRLWTADGAKEVHRWTLTAEQAGNTLAGLAFSPDGKQLAVSAAMTVVWNVETRAEVRSLKGEGQPAFSPDGKLLATVRGGSELIVRDAATGAEQLALRIDSPGLTAIAFAPDGKRVALGGPDGVVRTWDIATKAEVQVIRGQQGSVFGLAFSPDGTRMVTSIGDPLELARGNLFFQLILAGRTLSAPAVRVWDTARGQDYRLLAPSPKAFAAHPSRPEVAVASGKEVAFYHSATGAKLRAFVAAPEDVAQLAYSPDGSTLAVAWSVPPKLGKVLEPGVQEVKPVKNPWHLQLLDAATGKPKAEPHAQEAAIDALEFSPDGALLATSGGKTLTLLDAATGQLAATLNGAEGGQTHLAFGPNGMLVRATTGVFSRSNQEPDRIAGEAIEVWDVANRKRLRTVDAGKGLCDAIAVTPDGKLLAAVVGSELTLIRLDTGEQKVLPTAARALKFSPDGQRLAALTPVGVKFWDPISGRDILTLGGKWLNSGNIGQVAFANPGGLVLVTESDGLRVYDGRPWLAPPPPPKPPREPKSEPPADDRPDAVKAAVAKSVAALEANDSAAAALHAVAALEAEIAHKPEAPAKDGPSLALQACIEARQQTHRLRVALALQATPKLRPVVPPDATEPTGYAADKVIDPPSTPNVCNPTRRWNEADYLLRSADGSRVATWNSSIGRGTEEEAKQAGRTPWIMPVYDTATGKLVAPPIDFQRRPFWRSIALSPDGKRLATVFHSARIPKDYHEYGDTDPNEPKVFVVRAWDVDTRQRIGPDMIAPRPNNNEPTLWFAARGRLLVLDAYFAEPIIWDLPTGKLLAVPEAVRAVHGRPEDPFLVTATGTQAHVRDAGTLAVVGKPFVVDDLRHAAVSADGQRVVLANSYWLGAWDAKTGQRSHPRFAVFDGAKCVAITPDGSRFAAGFAERDGTALARVWDAETGDAISPPLRTGEVCHDMRFLAGGRVLLTLADKTVRLWDARTGEPLTPPLTGDGQFDRYGGHQADAAVSGEHLFVRYSYQASQYDRWSLTPEPHDVAALRELAEALAGRRLDAQGNPQAIPADQLLALRKRIAGQFPERFGGPVASLDAARARRMDPRVGQLVARLGNLQESAARRMWAAEALSWIKDPAGQGALLAALRDPDATVRRAAANSLGEFQPPAAETVQALVRVLREDKDDGARASAAWALRGPAAKTAKANLLRALKEDRAAGVRAGAARALRDADADPLLLAALRTALADGQPWTVRVQAAMSVAVLVLDDKEGVGVLASALECKDGSAEWSATTYLGELGPRAAPAAAALAKVVEKGNYQAHFIDRTWYAVQALSRIGPGAKPAVPVLLAKLGEDRSNPNPTLVTTNYVEVSENLIAYTLAHIGPDVVPDLLKVFKEDRDAHRRRAAVLALGYLGPPAKVAVTDLEAEAKKLADREEKNQDESWMAMALQRALGRINDPNAIPVEKMQ
jgi:WD40 repeat protein/HEAT repeat protein